MFGRGTWAIVGLAKDSVEGFRASLEEVFDVGKWQRVHIGSFLLTCFRVETDCGYRKFHILLMQHRPWSRGQRALRIERKTTHQDGRAACIGMGFIGFFRMAYSRPQVPAG
jgi:hypothetical protein